MEHRKRETMPPKNPVLISNNRIGEWSMTASPLQLPDLHTVTIKTQWDSLPGYLCKCHQFIWVVFLQHLLAFSITPTVFNEHQHFVAVFSHLIVFYAVWDCRCRLFLLSLSSSWLDCSLSSSISSCPARLHPLKSLPVTMDLWPQIR